MKNLLRLLLFPLLGPMRKQAPDTAPPPPANPDQVHIFHGTFASELEATDYCLTPMGRNKPEPLTRDLPGATIITSEVEIIFGPERINAALPMLKGPVDALFNEIGHENTIVMIAEAAFGGLHYTLNDTPKLRYAGPFEVR